MKKFREDAVYVQRKDLAYLIRSDIGVPASIYITAFGNVPTVIDRTNREEFVKFDEDEEIKFFKDAEWIFDYDKFINMSEEELIEFGKKLAEEKNSIARSFNSMSDYDKKQNMIMVQQCDLLEYEMYSVSDIIILKKALEKNKSIKQEKKGLLTFIKKLTDKHN